MGRMLGWDARNRMVAMSHITSNCSRASNSRDANQQQLGFYTVYTARTTAAARTL